MLRDAKASCEDQDDRPHEGKTAVPSELSGEGSMRQIAVINPTTGRLVECRIDGLTHAELEALPLDDQICDEVAREVAPCLPEEFLAAYVIRVGVVRARVTILGAWLEDRARRWANLGSDTHEALQSRLVTE
jgi:hypothetical protein